MSDMRERFVAPVTEIPRQPLPEWPQGWYAVGRSRALRRGQLRRLTLAGREIVLFRTDSGAPGAVDAHCPHMGAHLGHGRVRGEQLECALHCWRIGVDGRVQGQDRRARAWEVRERAGLILLEFGGQQPLPAAGEPDFIWADLPPIDVAAHWHALTANAFDMPHLVSVHRRELVEPPRVSFEAGRHFEMHYVTRVRGRGLSDRTMKWLSGNRIQARMRCYGPLVTVDTDLGFTRTAAMVGMLPTPQGTRLLTSFGTQPGALGALRVRITRWLFAAFLRRDLTVIEGMRLRTDVDDPIIQQFFSYLRTLRAHAPPP